MVNAYEICELCKAIQFAKLPFEDELGMPHQPSLKALKDSAKSCALCELILEAALGVRENVDNVYRKVDR